MALVKAGDCRSVACSLQDVNQFTPIDFDRWTATPCFDKEEDVSRTYRFTAVSSLIGLALVASVRPASAQLISSASINAVANVTGVAPLSASGVNDLNFGSVTAGTPKAPSSLAANAGRFNISGQPSAPVTVSFALPSVLDGAGGATIPITFGGTDGLEWASFPGTFTTFNPNAQHFTSLSASGNLIIGISGLVSPPLLTSTGTYTGTITLTVQY